MYDVIIVGAGPAGSTLAAEVATNRRVLLIDPRNLESSIDSPMDSKLCGGLIAPDAQRIIGQMGVGLPRHVLAEPQLSLVRAIDRQSGVSRYYQRNYINVDRFRFDQFLYSRARNRVAVAPESRVVSITRDDSRIVVRARTRNSEFEESCRALVGADGGSSQVRKQAVDGGLRTDRTYLAVQDSFVMPDQQPHFTVLFDPGATDFYSWAIPKNGTLLVGSAVRVSRYALDAHERAVEALRECDYELRHRLSRRTAVLVRPTRASDISTGSGQVLLIGEAAGLISPSSAEGMSYAFASALIAADTLCAGLHLAHKRYSRAVRRLRRQVLARNAKGVAIYSPLLRRLAMSSGIGSVAVRGPADRAAIKSL